MQERADILKISKSIMVLVKMKMSFILWKKPKWTFFGQPNLRTIMAHLYADGKDPVERKIDTGQRGLLQK